MHSLRACPSVCTACSVQDRSDRSCHFEVGLLPTCQVSVAADLSNASIDMERMQLVFCDATVVTLIRSKQKTCWAGKQPRLSSGTVLACC